MLSIAPAEFAGLSHSGRKLGCGERQRRNAARGSEGVRRGTAIATEKFLTCTGHGIESRQNEAWWRVPKIKFGGRRNAFLCVDNQQDGVRRGKGSNSIDGESDGLRGIRETNSKRGEASGELQRRKNKLQHGGAGKRNKSDAGSGRQLRCCALLFSRFLANLYRTHSWKRS